MVGTVPRSLADWNSFDASPGRPRPGAGRWSPAEPGATHRECGVARHGPGSDCELRRLSSRAEHGTARRVAQRLLHLLVAAFVGDGPVVLDETIERRWGTKIKARGIYRDPVRSSHGHFVKASGLRWLCVMLLFPGLAGAAVPDPPGAFRTLRPKPRPAAQDADRRQVLLQTARWLPDRRIVADSSFSVIELLRSVSPYLDVVTRLRLDAGLYEPPPPRRPGDKGRPRVKGARLPTLTERVADPTTAWQRVVVQGWYGSIGLMSPPARRYGITPADGC